MKVTIKAHSSKQLLETNKDRLLQKKMHTLQDDSVPAAEELFAEHFERERQAVISAVSGAVTPATAFTLASAQILSPATPLLAIYESIREPVKSLYFPTATKFLPANWWAEFLAGIVAEQVVNITVTTRTQIKEITDEAFRDGWRITDIVRALDTLYLENIIPHRSMVIARTEVIRASNAAAFVSASEMGIPMRKRWLSAPDGRTRLDHALANGQVREPDQPFDVGGYQLLYPGDTSFGAPGEQVIQCRCTLVFVEA